jgi:uncharacterized protein YbjT (DUF2867 family)
MIFGAGENPISFITIGDVSEAAAQAAINAEAANRDIEVGGPEPVSPNAALRIFEEVIGSPFEVEYVSEPALEAQKANTEDAHTQSVTALSLDFAHGDVVDTSTMTMLLPFERSSVRQYIEALPRD